MIKTLHFSFILFLFVGFVLKYTSKLFVGYVLKHMLKQFHMETKHVLIYHPQTKVWQINLNLHSGKI